MMKEMKAFWHSLNHVLLINQRELVLGVTACTLAGFVAGMLLSPKKSVTIGSNNGNNNSNSAPVGLSASDEETGEETDEE